MTTQISSSGGANKIAPAQLALREAKAGLLSKAAGTVAASMDRIPPVVRDSLSQVIQPKGRTV